MTAPYATLPAASNQETERLWEFYCQMALIRRVEETLLELFAKGSLFGTVHTCLGQEACAVGVVGALDKDRDVVWSGHRGHGHFLAYCDDVEGLIGEILGRQTGVCRGIGGSQHLHKRNFYSNGVLGGTIPCAVGSALAEKAKRAGSVTAVFFGDGALGEGVLYESLNMAALWGAPVLFVLEDNGIAQTTPTHLEHAGSLARRAEPFGIDSLVVSAKSVQGVYAAASAAIQEIREGSRPQFLVLETTRLGPHSKGDDTRPVEELVALRARDPVANLRFELVAMDSARVENVEERVQERVTLAVEQAKVAPFLGEQGLRQLLGR